jgi:hypothetical protein
MGNFVKDHFGDYKSYQEEIKRLDYEALLESNQGLQIGSPYFLQFDMTPCPFEGDLLNAKVVLLLANPGVNGDDIREINHNLPIEGWGIKNLSLEIPSNWYRKRFKTLLDEENSRSWQWLSNNLAMIQIVPWASKKWRNVKLPSRHLMAETVQRLIEVNPNVLIVVMRQKNYWLNVIGSYPKIIINKRPICSYITQGNFGDDWHSIRNQLHK